MYTHPQHSMSADDVTRLRQAAGKYLRGLREAAGLSQRQMADAMGFPYYTFISQVESGRGRVPPERYAEWARIVGVPARDFVMALMRYYDPITFTILYGEPAAPGTAQPAPAQADLEARIAALEAKIAKP